MNSFPQQLRQIKHSKFVRSVAVVATGTAAAQAINIGFAPLLTRLYGPEAFGALGTFQATVQVVAPLAALSYPIAMVLPKRDVDAQSLAKLSLGLAAALSLLAAFITFALQEPILALFNIEEIGSAILLLPLAMSSAATLAVLSQWVIRKRLFKLKAKVVVYHSILLNSTKTFGGIMAPVGAVLVSIAAIGGLLHAYLLYRIVNKKSDTHPFRTDQSPIKTEENKASASYQELVKRHGDFAIYRTPQMVINAASQSLPILMLAGLFGAKAAGFYTLGKMVLSAPTAVLGKAVGDVFYPRIAEAGQNGEPLTPLVVKATAGLLALGALPFGIVIVFGPWLFGLIFGDEWLVAGQYAQWIALWIYFMFANQPAIKALPVLKAQGFHLIFTVFTISIRAGALAAGYFLFASDLVAVALFGVSGMALNITLVGITVLLCKRFDTQLQAPQT